MVAPALSPKTETLARALDRATAERVVVYRIDSETLGVGAIVDGMWTDKPYRLAILVAGPRISRATASPASTPGPASTLPPASSPASTTCTQWPRTLQASRQRPSPRRRRAPLCGMAMADPMHEVFCDA